MAEQAFLNAMAVVIVGESAPVSRYTCQHCSLPVRSDTPASLFGSPAPGWCLPSRLLGLTLALARPESGSYSERHKAACQEGKVERPNPFLHDEWKRLDQLSHLAAHYCATGGEVWASHS